MAGAILPSQPRAGWMQRSAIPDGAGIGLRFQHHRAVVDDRPEVAWLEVHAENYMGGGAAPRVLHAIRCEYPLSLHGIGLSLGSAEGVDPAHVARVRSLIERFEPGLVSEHLAFSVVEGNYLADLLPLPLTDEALDVVCRNVDCVQASLRRRILLENPSSYLRFAHSTIPEWEFITAVAKRTGCGILCDINNIYVSACNHGWNASAYIAALPARAVGEIHLAGHTVRHIDETKAIRIDDHGSRVAPAVWALYAEALARFGPVPTLIEWDTDVPALDVLLDEARQAGVFLQRSRENSSIRTPSEVLNASRADTPAPLESIKTHLSDIPSLHDIQRTILRSILLRENAAAAAAIVGDDVAAEQRLAIHRNTFFTSLTNALRLTYPAVDRLVGADFFDGAAEVFVHERPPLSAWLEEYGEEFPDFLSRFAGAASLPYLADVARLEWAVRRALHAPDAESVDVAQLAATDEVDHDRVCFATHPSVSLVRSNYPVDAIWHAVREHDDDALNAIDLAAGPVWLIVQRSTGVGGIGITRIDENAWPFAEQLFAGLPLCVALKSTGGAEAPAWLAAHLAAGRFAAFSLTDTDDIRRATERAP